MLELKCDVGGDWMLDWEVVFKVENLWMIFGEMCVFDDVFLIIELGEMVVLIGLLGFGKLMLLCVVVGL